MSVASLLSESRVAHTQYRNLANVRGADKLTPLQTAAQKRYEALQADPDMSDPAWVETLPRATHADLVAFYEAKQLWPK